ncbi:MAG: glycoside hydrolase 15-related protein [Actinomycetia bacterium]|nr:glycoside hydrolase 15-related protein [Actinomycetes bacterium]
MSGRPDRPIGDYGLVGDTRTATLVSSDGAIDWMCVPRFDGEPLFGRLIGGPTAGTFRVGPTRPPRMSTRRYRPGTATLETTWEVDGASLTLTDGMVAEPDGRLLPSTLLVRRLTAVGGAADVTMLFDPRFGEARNPPRSERRRDGLVCSRGALAVSLGCEPRVEVEAGRAVRVTIAPDRPLTLVLAIAHREPLIYVEPDAAWDALESDERRWREWTAGIDAGIPYRDAVVRSLLTLRLLTYSPSGAPVAAPTTSLPEELAGGRNWDYRFAWPRDASIGIGAFLGVGKQREARSFLRWLLHASRLDRPRLPVLLTLHGKHPRPERTLDDWPGYAGSRPVRVGNGAADQHQLDTYGWVLDAAWLLTRAGHPLYSETWRAMSGFADRVARRWRLPDNGIWEIRGDPQHHVHSKLMAWLALDRALRIAVTHRTSARRRARWQHERNAIADDVRRHGFNEARGSYTRAYGSDDLDAAVLVLPLLGIEPIGSTRVDTTIAAISDELGASGPLLYRYPPGRDGLTGSEGAFLPCAFWLVQALATTGKVDEATERFEALLQLATPLGLYAEEIDPTSREHLGNFPQALTHAALVQAALALRDASGCGRRLGLP